MDKETIIGIKHTCSNYNNCNNSFIETISSDGNTIKSNTFMCLKCGYILMKEIIRASSHIIDEYAYQRLCTYETELSKGGKTGG